MSPENAIQPKKSKHVLVIDDDKSIQTSLEELLQVCGFKVTLASDGLDGAELALALRPDIALVDMSIPKLSGLETAARIRAALGNTIYIIALSGYSKNHYQAYAALSAFDEYLVKPTDPEKLIQILQQ